MAVDAQHLNNHFPQQLMKNADMLMSAIDGNNIDINTMMYNTNQHIAAGTATVESTLLPVYASPLPGQNNQMKDDSGLTYAIPSMMQRKRPRDHSTGSTINQQSFAPAATYQKVESFNHSRINNNINNRATAAYSFLGEDVSVEILQQQLDIDRFIYQHMEKVRMEIDERRRRNSRRMIQAVEEGILKRLKAKEYEIEEIGKLNWALEERVRSLSVENQIWRELAQTNEATATALRSNLEHVLAQFAEVRAPEVTVACPINNLDDDAESCCGSSSPDQHLSYDHRGEEDETGWRTVSSLIPKAPASGMCRRCGKGEACAVLLTCRHMPLCASCGSTRNGTTTVTCPVCKSVNDATLLVNLSS